MAEKIFNGYSFDVIKEMARELKELIPSVDRERVEFLTRHLYNCAYPPARNMAGIGLWLCSKEEITKLIAHIEDNILNPELAK